MRWAVLLLLAACIESQSVPCGDGFTCPEGTVCRTLTDPMQRLCVSQDQIDACEGRAELDECPLEDVAIARCYQGVCLEAGCGNLRTDPDEACDDGNAVVGDGCSFACASDESCGNAIVDPATIVDGVAQANEQCDDGNQIGRDGCASTCASESATWEQLIVGKPPGRFDTQMVFDVARGRVVLFGGRSTTTDARSDTWEWDGRGWSAVTTAIAPTVRYGHIMVYDAHRRRTVLHGGAPSGDPSTILADTWAFDGTRWSLLEPANTPTPRRTHAAAVYDSARQRIVMFGGRDENNTLLDDTWVFDGTDWSRLDVTLRPAARTAHAMAYDPIRGVVVLGAGTSAQETWEFDGAAWRDVTPANPSDRTPQTGTFRLAYDPTTRQVIALGGGTADTWGWNGTVWTKLATGSAGTTSPATPGGYALVTDSARGNVLVFGGARSVPCGILICIGSVDESWLWSGTQWQQVASDAPVPRQRFASAYDSVRGRLVIFGGTDQQFTTVYADTWELGETHWRQHVTTPAPAARHGASMVFDTARGVTVLFGGENFPEPTGTWIWNGTQWSDALPATSPPGRHEAAFAFDPVRGRAVLFGGNSFGIAIADTWEWDGTTWHAMSPVTSPPARFGAAATFDPVRRRVVLFGGASGTSSFRDTWEWDGTTWSKLSPTAEPSAREGAALVWHAPRKRLTLFGGSTGSSSPFGLSDTWELDGNTWRQLIADSSATGRRGHALVQARDGAGVLVFGGRVGLAPTSELWRLRFRSSSEQYELCTIDEDHDGDGLAGCADADCWAACSPLCPPDATCEPSWPRCGDGTCSGPETCRLCPMDCTCTAVCGDTFCDPPETAATCAGDC